MTTMTRKMTTTTTFGRGQSLTRGPSVFSARSLSPQRCRRPIRRRKTRRQLAGDSAVVFPLPFSSSATLRPSSVAAAPLQTDTRAWRVSGFSSAARRITFPQVQLRSPHALPAAVIDEAAEQRELNPGSCSLSLSLSLSPSLSPRFNGQFPVQTGLVGT